MYSCKPNATFPLSRIGADVPEILAELGYSSEDIERLVSTGAVGKAEWIPVKILTRMLLY